MHNSSILNCNMYNDVPTKMNKNYMFIFYNYSNPIFFVLNENSKDILTVRFLFNLDILGQSLSLSTDKILIVFEIPRVIFEIPNTEQNT